MIARSAGLGHGSTFSVELPLSNQAQPELPPADPSEDGDGRLKGLRVLLVDDSPEVVDVMRMLLEMEDALVSSYLDPRQALQEAAEKRFDVILTDIGMPEMDGHEFVSALREKNSTVSPRRSR